MRIEEVTTETYENLKPGFYVGSGELEDTQHVRKGIEEGGSGWSGPFATEAEARQEIADRE